MAHTLRFLGITVLAVAVGACAPPPPPDTTAADTAAINALRDAWVTAYNAADADGVANLYTEDAIDMPSEQPTLTGRAAIREHMAAQFGMGTAVATVTSAELQLMGDWAYDRGAYTVNITPAAGGDAMMMGGRYIVILRKQADGSWLLARGIDNSPVAPAGM